MDGFLTALRAELYVALRSGNSRTILLLPTIVVLAQLLLVKLTELGSIARDALLADGENASVMTDSAYGYFVDSVGTGLILLGLTLVALAAYTFANDRDTGAIRHILIRRSSRIALLLAKLCYLHILALASLVLLLGVAWFLSGMLWDFTAVVEDGFELIGVAEIRQEILLGLQLALLPIPAAIAFGLLISVLAQNAVQAVSIALGITLALDIFKTLLGNFSHYIYVSYQPSLIDQSYLKEVSRLVRGYSDVLIDERVLQLNLWVPLPEMLVLVAVTLVIVRRREI